MPVERLSFLDPSTLPTGWYLAPNELCLHMGEAHVHVLQAPDPDRRLRGPEWRMAVAWRVPVPLGAGICTFETVEVYADTDGYGFWGALREAVSDWCGEMPPSLRDRLLAEIAPRATSEARAALERAR